MKSKYIIISLMSLFLFACQDDLKLKYTPSLAPGGDVQAVMVSPSTLNFYVDSPIPVLTAFCVPTNSNDSTILWSSDRPDILDIEPQTGKLIKKTIVNAKVTITATNKKTGIYGTCVITVSNTLGVYRYIDLTKEVGLWILDRNVGATAPSDYRNPSDRGLGNYYHFRNNTPVANREHGGPDGRGGSYFLYNNQDPVYSIYGGYPTFNVNWNGTGMGMSAWDKGEETPCPCGWRLPTKAEMELIIYKASPENFPTVKEKGASILFRDKLGLIPSGFIRVPGRLWESFDSWWWTSDYDEATYTAYPFRADTYQYSKGNSPLVPMKVQEVKLNELFKGVAMPVRCVKAPGEECREN